MDLTEAFAPSQPGGTATEEKTTDYFDFVVSPPPHCANPDGTDDDSFLHRAGCRTTIGFLGGHHDGFIKETNNNTLTALPPVSTITGHIAHHNSLRNNNNNSRNCHLTGSSDPVGMDQSGQDCDYWVTEDTKEQTCNILLEDLNKYCWNTQTASPNDHQGLLVQRRDSPLSDGLQVHRDCSTSGDDRQNTDGAIYTLTVLNSEANSMDGLECCKSPNPGSGTDGWSLRPNHLDLDAILNMESSVSIGGPDNTDDTDRQQQQLVVTTANGERYTTTQYTQDDAQAFTVQVKTEVGDNNNDWKLSDRNNLQETVTVTESAAESLLRNALQGKLYPTTTTLAGARLQLGGDSSQSSSGGQQSQDEPMQTCADDLLLSQLDVDQAYRTELKNIANEVVESYCNLEPVCNVAGTTVMYTLDPASGSLGTITLPADLAQVGTVTVVTTAPPQQDVLVQDTRHTEAQSQTVGNQTTANQLQIQGNTTSVSRGTSGTKPAKKYVRRSKANGATAANTANTAGQSNNPSTGSPAGGSPGSVQQQQRKERSLHYCSICSKGFKDKYSVNVHIRTHTGEKPFACSLCGKSFRQKAHLAKHYQTHVTQKPSVAAAAQAAVAVNTGTSTNNSSSSNSSSKSISSPVAVDDQQQQLSETTQESQIVTAVVCNPTS